MNVNGAIESVSQSDRLGEVSVTIHTAQILTSEVRRLQSRVDRLESALRYLYDSGPTPEGFDNLEEDCYEYAVSMMEPDEVELPDGDPRWFEAWLRMIGESAKRAAESGKGE